MLCNADFKVRLMRFITIMVDYTSINDLTYITLATNMV